MSGTLHKVDYVVYMLLIMCLKKKTGEKLAAERNLKKKEKKRL